MTRILLTFLITTYTSIALSQSQKPIQIKPGKWSGQLQLTSTDVLPFEMTILKENKIYAIQIHNAEETINLVKYVQHDDSVTVSFPNFNSTLTFHPTNSKSLNGYWTNYNKGSDYLIPFYANYGEKPRFNKTSSQQTSTIDGKWEISFSPDLENEYPAIGIFNQVGNDINGTFLTETGDYRYLAGNIYGTDLFLSCFDGSHAFLFKAKFNEGILKGEFYSGSDWKTNWIGKPNELFTLANTDSITYLVKNKPFSFSSQDLEGNTFNYPNEKLKDKVIIIQLMGTWCPNCLDETRYYKELYDTYHTEGLEIISIGYEIGDNFNDYSNNLLKLKSRLNLDFTFLVGGSANKNLASEQFNMLNEIISFPTSIFIGRDGSVKLIHTGFQGPGTGKYYTEYVIKTNALIESLLRN
jgi:thiol-disulfide isomerase/thioredoxin